MPLPSHTELSGDSRNSSGSPDASTLTCIGVRLHTQNLASGSPIRRSARSWAASAPV